MIDFQTALDIIHQHVTLLPVVTRTLSSSPGYVLAEDIAAREDIPLFDSSAVDGFALRSKDVATATKTSVATLKLVGEVQAGDTSGQRLRRGTMRILTGGPVPSGADAVVMKEDVVENDDCITLSKPPSPGANIRRRGEEFGKGVLALSTGCVITPPVVGLLATLGYPRVKVHRKPRVSLIITGNELRFINALLIVFEWHGVGFPKR